MNKGKESSLDQIEPFDAIIKGSNFTQVLQVLDDLNFIQPSKIQNQIIPILNDQKSDLIALAQPGSGLTTAIIISMLLHVDHSQHYPQTIYLCHTYELTMQAFRYFNTFNKYTHFKGGVCVKSENNDESPPCDSQLIFGTPSSINYWIKNGKLDASKVNFIAIDEADLVLDKKSSLYNSATLLMDKLLPPNVQYGFFSSSIKNAIIDFIKSKRPNIITIRSKRNQPTTIEHWYTRIDNSEQVQNAIYELVTSVSDGQAVIFTRSKGHLKKISEMLYI